MAYKNNPDIRHTMFSNADRISREHRERFFRPYKLSKAVQARVQTYERYVQPEHRADFRKYFKNEFGPFLEQLAQISDIDTTLTQLEKILEKRMKDGSIQTSQDIASVIMQVCEYYLTRNDAFVSGLISQEKAKELDALVGEVDIEELITNILDEGKRRVTEEEVQHHDLMRGKNS